MTLISTHAGTLAVDKAAAGRFIKHAISQARAAPGPSTHLRFDDDGTPHDVRVPLKVTEKMLAREQYLKELKEADDTDEMEEDLELYDEEVPAVVSNTRGDTKGKGKAQASPSTTPEADASRPAAERKRRRPVIDPFAGTSSLLSIATSCVQKYRLTCRFPTLPFHSSSIHFRIPCRTHTYTIRIY